MEGDFTICVFQGNGLMGCVIFLPGLWWVDMFQPWGKGIGITRCSWLVSCLEQVLGFWPVSTELVKPPLKKPLHLALFGKKVGRRIREEKGKWTQALKALRVRFSYITPFLKINSMCFLKEDLWVGKRKGEAGDSESRWPPGLCWIQNSCQDEQDLSLYRQPVQGWSLQCTKSNTDAKIIILRSDCDTVAVTADVPGTMWSSKPLFQLQTWMPTEGKPAEQAAPEWARSVLCWQGSTRRQGWMCSDSAHVVTNVSNLVFVTGLKTKTEHK